MWGYRRVNRTAAVAAMIGGLLMLYAQVTGAAAWRQIGDILIELTGNRILAIFFLVLVYIAALGGLLVILGGILVILKKDFSVFLGKLLIAIGAGFGFISLLMILVKHIRSQEPWINIFSVVGIGFVGLILSLVARMKAQ